MLAPYVPTAMLLDRNPTGISLSPEERAEDDDVEVGAQALATVLADLSTTAGTPARGPELFGQRSSRMAAATRSASAKAPCVPAVSEQ